MHVYTLIYLITITFYVYMNVTYNHRYQGCVRWLTSSLGVHLHVKAVTEATRTQWLQGHVCDVVKGSFGVQHTPRK